MNDQTQAMVDSAIDTATADAAIAAGRKTTVDEAVALALDALRSA